MVLKGTDTLTRCYTHAGAVADASLGTIRSQCNWMPQSTLPTSTSILQRKYAVDDELYRRIVHESSTQSTSAIHRQLRNIAYDAYLSDHQLFLCALSQNKIKRQKTLKHFVTRISDAYLQKLQRKKANAMSKFSYARLSLRQAQVRADADVELKTLLQSKENHNIVGDKNIIPGLGPSKISILIRNHIHSAKELLRAHPEQYPTICHLIPRWKIKIQEYYASLKGPVALLEEAIQDAQEDLVPSSRDGICELHHTGTARWR
jgi:hypothetical protein